MTTGLPDPQTDPAGFVLAVCDLREQRAKDQGEGRWWYLGPWVVVDVGSCTCGVSGEIAGLYGHEPHCGTEPVTKAGDDTQGRHIAAEANPDAVLADVALWRGVVERHVLSVSLNPAGCYVDGEDWPCPDLAAVVTAAQAYVGGAP